MVVLVRCPNVFALVRQGHGAKNAVYSNDASWSLSFYFNQRNFSTTLQHIGHIRSIILSKKEN